MCLCREQDRGRSRSELFSVNAVATAREHSPCWVLPRRAVRGIAGATGPRSMRLLIRLVQFRRHAPRVYRPPCRGMTIAASAATSGRRVPARLFGQGINSPQQCSASGAPVQCRSGNVAQTNLSFRIAQRPSGRVTAVNSIDKGREQGQPTSQHRRCCESWALRPPMRSACNRPGVAEGASGE